MSEYPKPVRERQGCKVGWYIYDKKSDAAKAAKKAKAEASRMSAQGYDFGFSTPGEIRELKSGEFEVVIP